jgi:hypothetical protein
VHLDTEIESVADKALRSVGSATYLTEQIIRVKHSPGVEVCIQGDACENECTASGPRRGSG